jgi:hypothetical protein
MTDPYTEIALHLPNDVRVGGALITMVEPEPGYEVEYNRWYEDDHFYSGAMQGPWMFAGRRWVAPKALRARRAAVADPIVSPPDTGCYIATYWMTEGHEEDAERWGFFAMDQALMPHGRGNPHRTHVYTSWHRYRFGIVRGSGPMKPHLALNAPYLGMHVEVIDAPHAGGLAALEAWLQEHLPAHLATSPAGQVLAFTPVPFSQGRIEQPGTPAVAPPEGVGKQLCLLWFLELDPRDVAEERLFAHHEALAATGLGELRFSGSFVPTVVGTNRYVDELR